MTGKARGKEEEEEDADATRLNSWQKPHGARVGDSLLFNLRVHNMAVSGKLNIIPVLKY